MKLFVSKVSEPTINRNSVANQHQHQQDLDHQIAHSPLASLDGSLVDPWIGFVCYLTTFSKTCDLKVDILLFLVF